MTREDWGGKPAQATQSGAWVSGWPKLWEESRARRGKTCKYGKDMQTARRQEPESGCHVLQSQSSSQTHKVFHLRSSSALSDTFSTSVVLCIISEICVHHQTSLPLFLRCSLIFISAKKKHYPFCPSALPLVCRAVTFSLLGLIGSGVC